MDFYGILLVALFVCSPILLFYIVRPRQRVNSYVVCDMKNRNNSKPIGEQFDSLDQIIRDNNLTIDFSGYFSHEE